MELDERTAELRQLLGSMTSSMSSARTALNSFKENPQALDMNNGISLLSVKQHLTLPYLASLVLASSRRVLGHSLIKRSKPSSSFTATYRERRGKDAGDLIDIMIESRVVLEKVETLESRMRYQIEKLLKIAEQSDLQEVTNDPLFFRPNPQNLTKGEDEDLDVLGDIRFEPPGKESHKGDMIYRPPHLAPVLYLEKTKNRSRQERPPVPPALAALSPDVSRPHIESSSGLGGIPGLASGRAKYLKRLTEFEEENFSRVIMKKSDAKRRAHDEADIALGGDLGGSNGRRGHRQAGALDDEFGDILRSVSRVSHVGQGDGYEELRNRGRKRDLLSRGIREDVVRRREQAFEETDREERQRATKRTRFELAAKIARKKVVKRKT